MYIYFIHTYKSSPAIQVLKDEIIAFLLILPGCMLEATTVSALALTNFFNGNPFDEIGVTADSRVGGYCAYATTLHGHGRIPTVQPVNDSLRGIIFAVGETTVGIVTATTTRRAADIGLEVSLHVAVSIFTTTVRVSRTRY